MKSVFILLALVALGLQAAETDTIKERLQKQLPNAQIDNIEETQIPGLYEVTLGPRIFYVSKDGRFLIQGNLVDLKKGVNLTEAKLAKVRQAALEKVGEDKMIIFSPKQVKHTVSVFTDIDCGYCRRLHSQIDDYLKRGIKVRYLFFPRAGKDSASYNKAVSVWCAKDRNQALTLAKQGKPIEPLKCDHPVDQHMKLAGQFGVSGTPMIVTEKGDILPGYVPPEQLSKYLEGKLPR
ncbi:MAG: disulfide bond formation protein DsbC [Methylothermaceae bacteria B42]|nr:MAG: disulfide bond formation protein DsbC [Methylothermaceae bacteria B42]HHJ38729.1 DsbC family protein [Methylothermaceae bacterium]